MTGMGPAGRRGYSLIELLVVLAILGTLAAMAMPLAEMTVRREKERELKRSLWEIRDAIDAYHRAQLQAVAPTGTTYPPSLVALTQPMADPRPEHRGEVLLFLRRVPRDPFADPALSAEQTWGLRSYLSDVEHPTPGADVYDVYSLAPGVGLNGVPLRQW